MKRQIPPDLKGAFPLSFVLALLLFCTQSILAVAVALQVTFWHIHSKGFDRDFLGILFLCVFVNGYALSRAVKARHFLGLFSEWPGLPEEGDPVPETRMLATAARQAFFHGDYDKVPTLIERLGSASAKASLARGRALAMAGRFEEALAPLDSGGQGSSGRRYLRKRSYFGLAPTSYFSARDIVWATHRLRLFLLSFVALGATVAAVAVQVQALDPLLAKKATIGFSEANFQVVTQGRFTLYYHDPKFMQATADMAEETLTQTLHFLGLPQESFAPGQIHLYLCSDQPEYLARSPYTHSWEAGSAMPSKNQIYVYPQPEDNNFYYEVVISHELTHLCYHLVVPTGREDSWLNEGFANYVGFKFALGRIHYPMQAWLNENKFKSLKTKALPFEAFLTENPQQMKDEERIHEFYTQGFSIVYVLIEQYGQESFVRFLRFFGAGKNLQQALTAAYPTIRDSVELQAVWDLFMR